MTETSVIKKAEQKHDSHGKSQATREGKNVTVLDNDGSFIEVHRLDQDRCLVRRGGLLKPFIRKATTL
jgi:hypothetical protein